MIFARIGNGPCYHHWNDIFAGVYQVSRTCALPKKNSPFERISHHYEDGQILRNVQDAQMQIAGF